eukprot:tig00020616_g12259.t1
MDGLESLRRLRAELPPGRLPYAVALSANVGSADRQQCAAAGYDAFLAKPRAPAFESLRKAKLRAASQPVMDGLESLRRLRAELPPGRLPYAVALSANVGSADRQQCAAAGYDAFLAKPVRGKDLAEALAAASAASAPAPAPRHGQALDLGFEIPSLQA